MKAKFTLSDNNGVYISKGKTYELHKEGKEQFIYDNFGKKMVVDSRMLKERFE